MNLLGKALRGSVPGDFIIAVSDALSCAGWRGRSGRRIVLALAFFHHFLTLFDNPHHAPLGLRAQRSGQQSEGFVQAFDLRLRFRQMVFELI